MSDSVTMVVGIVQTVLLAAAGAVAWYQVRESSRARVASTLLEIFQTIHSPGNARDRALLFHPEGSAEDDDAARRTIELFEWVSLLVDYRMLPRELVFDMYSDLFVAVWRAGEGTVTRARVHMANYAEHLENVAREAIVFRQRHYPGDVGVVEDAFRRLEPSPAPQSDSGGDDATEHR